MTSKMTTEHYGLMNVTLFLKFSNVMFSSPSSIVLVVFYFDKHACLEPAWTKPPKLDLITVIGNNGSLHTRMILP